METRSLSQRALASESGVALGTINGILKGGHVPKMETLLRLADFLGSDRLEMLVAAGYLRRADDLPRRDPSYAGVGDDDMEWRLVEEFRRVPQEYREDVIAQVKWIARLVKRPVVRVVGEEVT